MIDRRLRPAHLAWLIAVTMVLLLSLGYPAQRRHFVFGMLLTEWGAIFLPCSFFIGLFRLPWRSWFVSMRETPRPLLGAVCLGVSAWYLAAGWLALQETFLPLPRPLRDAMNERLFDTSRSLIFDIIAMAVSPAICEELLFRGVVLFCSLVWLQPSSAMLLNAAAFGLFHLSVYRLAPTTMLGFMSTWMAFKSRSIVPSCLFHLLNNAATLMAGRYAIRHGTLDQPWQLKWGALAALAFVLGTMAVRLHGHHPRDDAKKL